MYCEEEVEVVCYGYVTDEKCYEEMAKVEEVYYEEEVEDVYH